MEEDEILQQECTTAKHNIFFANQQPKIAPMANEKDADSTPSRIDSNTSSTKTTKEDQEIAQRVVQSLMAAFFLQKSNNHMDDDSMHMTNSASGDPTRRANTNLEAVSVEVETMAVQTLQAWTRGVSCRWRLAASNTINRRPRPGTKFQSKDPQQDPTTQMKLPGFRRVLSTASRRRASKLGHALDSVELSVETVAVVMLQSQMRGFLARVRKAKELPVRDRQKREQLPESLISTSMSENQTAAQPLINALVRLQQDESSLPSVNDNQPKGIKGELRQNGLVIQQVDIVSRKGRERLGLAAIPEKETATSQAIPTNHLGEQSTSLDVTQDDALKEQKQFSRRNLSGMKYLSESQKQLKSVTSIVKHAILVKMQALVRGFIVRRRRRQLRKENSVRALQSRRNLFTTLYKGTTEEHDAATTIQRAVRGYVQRWKYWTAMRQQQFDDILRLKAKQLRKLGERKKSILKSCRTQILFDATSLARQLDRAKRSIKFLVKQEQRTMAQNIKLSAEIADLRKSNQFLSNSTDMSGGSVDTLEAEIKSLDDRRERLQAKRTEYKVSVQQLADNLKEIENQTEDEKSRTERIQLCIEKVKEYGREFLREHPSPSSQPPRVGMP